MTTEILTIAAIAVLFLIVIVVLIIVIKRFQQQSDTDIYNPDDIKVFCIDDVRISNTITLSLLDQESPWELASFGRVAVELYDAIHFKTIPTDLSSFIVKDDLKGVWEIKFDPLDPPPIDSVYSEVFDLVKLVQERIGCP